MRDTSRFVFVYFHLSECFILLLHVLMVVLMAFCCCFVWSLISFVKLRRREKTFTWTYILIFNHLHHGIPSDPFPSAFPTNNLYEIFFSLFVLHALLILLGKLRCPSLCSFLQPPATSSLLYPNILQITLFSNIHSLWLILNTTFVGHIFCFVENLAFLEHFHTSWRWRDLSG
jgi:hypothetical protein